MIWLYLQKAMYRPCDLDLWPMKVNIFLCIEYHPINILHRFQIDISSRNKIPKYWPDTHTDRQTDTHTDRQTDRVETIPRNPLRGRGNNSYQTVYMHFIIYQCYVYRTNLRHIPPEVAWECDTTSVIRRVWYDECDRMQILWGKKCWKFILVTFCFWTKKKMKKKCDIFFLKYFFLK